MRRERLAPRDVINPIAREERRWLLATSAIGIVLGYTRSIPTKIAMLGIDLTLSDQQVLITALQAVIVYFAAATYLHVGTDMYVLISQENLRDPPPIGQMLREVWGTLYKGALALGSYRIIHIKERAFFFAFTLFVFEILLPIILAITAFVLLNSARIEPLVALPLVPVMGWPPVPARFLP